MKYEHTVPQHWGHQRAPCSENQKLRGQATCDNPLSLPLHHSKVNLTITGAPRAVFQMNEGL